MFERRETQTPTAAEWAAERLGLPVGDLTLLAERCRPVALAVGVCLLVTQTRCAAQPAGATPTKPATVLRVQGAGGDLRAFQGATVALPAGVLDPVTAGAGRDRIADRRPCPRRTLPLTG